MREARRLLQSVGVGHIRPSTMVGQLGNADQQVVEIAKAQARPLKLLILDEPTSSLTPHEVEGLFGITRRLRAEARHRFHQPSVRGGFRYRGPDGGAGRDARE